MRYKSNVLRMGGPRPFVDRLINGRKSFIPYNWGRIYPSNNALDALAYTVSIEADDGFVVKIDLVDIKVTDPTLRKRYEEIRGRYTSSPIVAIKLDCRRFSNGLYSVG